MRKLLFFAITCVVFFISCSADDTGIPRAVNAENPNVISKPIVGDSDTVVIDDPILENNVVAHRGAWKKKNFPDNSIASLQEAIRLKCKGSEFDIQLTIDDSIVVCHDPTFNNLTIQNSKYSDLAVFKRSNGEKLPTLREYIIAGKQNNTTTFLFCEFKDTGLSPERKKVFINKTLDCVKKLNAQNLMVYVCFNIYLLKPLRDLEPSANLQYLNNDRSPIQLTKDKMNGVDYPFSVFDEHPDWIEIAKANGLTLNVWTINDPQRMDYYVEKNFDYITTDEPELLLSKQKKR